MAAAPWDDVPSHEQLFVLITGANSGIGLGIGQRLIDEFLASRSLTSHLILIPTTRSSRKSRETIAALRSHLVHAAKTSKVLLDRAGPSYNWRDTVRRVHVLCLQLDLCDIRGIYAFADSLVYDTVSNPAPLASEKLVATKDDLWEELENIKIPRLDAIIFNAGFGGWTGMDWYRLIIMFFSKGLTQFCTWPNYKVAPPGAVLDMSSLPQDKGRDLPVLGKVFCSNVFGHYLLGHRLLPLLSRAQRSDPAPGRIIWTSSIEPSLHSLNRDDLQGILTDGPYESSKRLTDLLSLTYSLPSVARYSDPYFHIDDPKLASALPIRPRVYLTHPGIVVSTLFPLSVFLVTLYEFALYLTRWIGSPWHVVTGYKGAAAASWITLRDQTTLDALEADRAKWGSACNRSGRSFVKLTEVDGWGWHGRVEELSSLAKEPRGPHAKLTGRNPNTALATKDSIQDFQAEGVECWKDMERLRREWEGLLELGGDKKARKA